MEDDQIAHIAGVFDAVGAVTVHILKNDSHRIGYAFRPVVRLHWPAEGDIFMGKLDAYCEQHGVKYNVKEKESSYVFEVFGEDNIEAFIEPLVPWLVHRHGEAMVMLDDIIPRVRDGDHRTKEGFLSLMPLADELRSKSRHGKAHKYDTDYFIEEWGQTPQA